MPVIFKAGLGQRTDQDFQQFGIDIGARSGLCVFFGIWLFALLGHLAVRLVGLIDGILRQSFSAQAPQTQSKANSGQAMAWGLMLGGESQDTATVPTETGLVKAWQDLMAKPLKNTIALVYDFDGTLSPQPMQEYTVLPALGVQPEAFWRKVAQETARTGGEDIITYMRMMYEEAEAKKIRITREDLKALGTRVKYYKGVEAWFENIDTYVQERSQSRVKTEHYIISSGLREILEGVSIFGVFKAVFASEYFFNHHGVATYPQRVITDTSKTQYLFRINKGVLDLSQSINSHMPETERPIPFANIIYFGDGMTDVPSMAVTRANGGHAVAVYPPRKSTVDSKLLFRENRCDFYAPADYRAGSRLHERTCLILDKIMADILYQSEKRTLKS